MKTNFPFYKGIGAFLIFSVWLYILPPIDTLEFRHQLSSPDDVADLIYWMAQLEDTADRPEAFAMVFQQALRSFRRSVGLETTFQPAQSMGYIHPCSDPMDVAAPMQIRFLPIATPIFSTPLKYHSLNSPPSTPPPKFMAHLCSVVLLGQDLVSV